MQLTLRLAALALAVIAIVLWIHPPWEAAAQGSISVRTLADITGDGSTHALSTFGTARWVQIIAPSGNSAAVRIGDSNASSSRGAPIAAGGGILMPASINQFL